MGQHLEGSTITTYKYDYADRLVKRTTGDSTMEYYYDGDRLVAQSSSDGSKIYYFYDDAGVCGAEYNNEYYEFVRNIFGDIVVVLKGGEIAGRYEYDPFGVCTEYTQNNFVKLNPFRYRGYFYDTVSGMYLLKTRYYDPVTAQFLSPDHPDYLDPETLGGIDLYAYCLNNPVMGYDPEGTWNWSAFGLIAAIVVSAVVGVALTIASGGIAGAVLGGAAIGFSASATENLVTQVSTSGWENVDYGQAWKEGGIGAAVGAVSGFFSYGVSSIASAAGKSIGFAFSQASHIGSGIQFGKVFGVKALTTLGSGIGNVVGSIAGATFGEYFANKFFMRDYSFNSDFGETVKGELPGLIRTFLKWAL